MIKDENRQDGIQNYTIEELAKQYLKEGKTNNEQIALLMAKETKAKERAKKSARALKAALHAQEKLAKAEARKARNHLLIQLGGLVAKAGLEDEDKGVIYGALLEAKAALDGPEREATRARFKTAGAQLNQEQN